jgi:putative membrane protein
MITVWLKAIHVIAIAVWAGGLIWLPGMLVHGRGRPRAEIVHIHRFARFGFDVLVSPAAVIAVASGTALIFSVGVAEGWLYLKLAAIAGMVVVHLMIGAFLDWEVRKANTPGRTMRLGMAAASAVLASVVLWLVLAKPQVDVDIFPWWLLQRPVRA